MMVDIISDLTSDVVKLALNTAIQRHKVIANNVANANTPGFIPNYVSFEEQFSEAFKASEKLRVDSVLESDFKKIKPEILSQDESDTTQVKVRVDEEMVNMTKNALHYQALLEGLSKKGSLVKLAIKGS